MPVPIFVGVAAIAAAIESALAGVTISGLVAAATATIAGLLSAEAIMEWLDSKAGAELVAEQLNKRLAAAGVDLEFPPFNPLIESGREIFQKTIEKYALQRLNTKAGTNFATVADLTPANFEIELGRILAAPINTATKANFTTIWPVEKLKDQLHTEVMRQFDNRGRYASGALFKGNTMMGIKASIAAKHPELMLAAPQPLIGGRWGPARDAAHAAKREKGRIRQDKYRRTHQQTYFPK